MAIQKKTEGRDLDEYLQEVWDSLEPAWDKSKFDMKQGYDSEYECDCITITSKDNEGVLAKIYVNDYDGRHPVGFDVVYRYPGDKGVGVMGSYEFQSTDMDGLGEEVFDYFDEIKQKAAGASFESDLQAYADAVKADKYDKQSVIDDGWEFYNSVEYDEDIVRDDFKKKYDGKAYLLHITFNPSTKDVSDVKWDISAIESKQTEADATFKVGDFVSYEAGKDGKDPYDAYVYCEVIGINDDGTLALCPYGTDADTKGIGDNANPAYCEKLDHYAGMVDANTYYTDGKYKAYKGGWEILITDKELDPKVYEFIGTMDDLSEVVDFDDYYGGENFVYDEDLRDDLGATGVDTDGVDFADMSGDLAKASGSPEESKKSEGLPPKKLGGNRKYRSRADLINKMKALDAVEITTPAQFNDIHNKQWLHTAGYAMDINGNRIGQTYFGDKDGKWYYATTKTFQGDYLPESKKSENATTEEDAIRKAFKSIISKVPANVKSNFDEEFVTDNMEALLDLFNAWFVFEDGEFVTTVRVVDPDNENGDYYDEDDEAYQWNACYNVTEGIIDLLGWNYGEETVKQPIQDALFYDFIGTKYIDNSNESKNHKKSESLTLKQKELKDMARFGQAEDITTISDEEAKALRKKGIETIGISRGTYGMNGALLRDNEGKKYVITARSSNLFYFV